MSARHWDDQTFQREELSRFEGKTIAVAVAEDMYGRTNALSLVFTDGSTAEIRWWAAYADDAGLELKWETGRNGDTSPPDSQSSGG